MKYNMIKLERELPQEFYILGVTHHKTVEPWLSDVYPYRRKAIYTQYYWINKLIIQLD
jgi:hypothetical protein